MTKIIEVSGKAVPVRGDDIDTDRIVPARFLKEITFDKMGDFLFIDARTNEDGSLKDHPLNQEKYKEASIMIVGKNFGCGSSREHAPQAIMRYGIKALIGESFAEIFAGNCKSLGVPTIIAKRAVLEELWAQAEKDPQTNYSIDLLKQTLTYGEKTVDIEIPEKTRQALTNGTWNDVALLKDNLEKVKSVAQSLPYVNNFE